MTKRLRLQEQKLSLPTDFRLIHLTYTPKLKGGHHINLGFNKRGYHINLGFNKRGYELIRQVVDAAARQKFGREIKWDFWMLCMFCLNKIGLNNRYTTNLFTLFNIDQFYYLFTKIRSCAMITNTNFRIPILSQPDVVEI